MSRRSRWLRGASSEPFLESVTPDNSVWCSEKKDSAMTYDDDPPVAGRSSLKKPAAYSKWSRRGRSMRRILLLVWKIAALFVAVIRAVRWVFENL